MIWIIHFINAFYVTICDLLQFMLPFVTFVTLYTFHDVKITIIVYDICDICRLIPIRLNSQVKITIIVYASLY